MDERQKDVSIAMTNMFKSKALFVKEDPFSEYLHNRNLDKYISSIIETSNDLLRVKYLKTYQKCVLPDEVRRNISASIYSYLNSSKFVDWGIEDEFEKGITNSILLYGPPGTGKTMLAETIAGVLDKSLIIMDKANVTSSLHGQTEKNIQDTFNQARENDAVVFIDECESLLTDRNSVGAIMGSHINTLLTNMERYPGFVVMTTNRIRELDPALERRILIKVKLDNPSKEARIVIWKNLIPQKMPITKLDFDLLAEANLTGGDIKNVIINTGRRCISEGKEIVTMHDFIEQIRFEVNNKKAFEDARPKRYERTKRLFDDIIAG